MKTVRYTALAVMLVLLHACTSLGLAQPETLSQRLGYAYAQNAALRQAAATQLNSGALKVDDAKYVLTVTDNSRTLLDTAKVAMVGGDINTAEGRLLLAVNVLDTLQKYLQSKVAK